MIEQQFLLWLSKHFKRRKLEYYLKLNDVPHGNTKGFRLNPDHYRDEKELEKYR